MDINLNERYSHRVQGMKKSVIRELLKLTAKPEIISFAGGLPSPKSFPVDELKIVIDEVMENEPEVALQYSATEGDQVLVEQLIKYGNKAGNDITEENLLVTTSSQQGLDLVSKVFIDPGAKVIVELPSYVGGLGAFNSYQADMIGVPQDADGMSAEILREKLEELDKHGEKPKFIYIVPDFQNPAGMTMTEERREEILEIAYEYKVLIVEDSPYRELRFEGEDVPTIYSMDDKGYVILLGTFSKIFAPGFRIGWIYANPEIRNKLVVAKQSTDLCSPAFSQRIIGRFMEKGYLEKNIEKIIEMYGKKKDLIIKYFNKYMPQEASWTEPEGGLFLLVSIPEHLDTSELFEIAIENNVAFVIGEAFHHDGSGKHTMRINFSYATEEQLHKGIKRLGKSLKEFIQANKKE
ncbi:MAG: PLP-dependent aminotransferase family protein [Candidatus Cloacimonetes bacterium]|nr:PLP-dependent aminotransferase family protein [Candidatus Cloacimonadota bacterium]MBS3766719.1 PLP-dependent aminotransferase family protein [Candidatus Cloacimonadota bacterium]